MPDIRDESCSIARSLGVLGERWTFLILRDAFEGLTRFEEFRASLGIASDVLSARLATLVDHGVMAKIDYQQPGQRRRHRYVLTDAGREALPVVAGLQAWGDRHLPREEGPTVLRRAKSSGQSIHIGFVDETGAEVALDDVEFVKTSSYPTERAELLARSAAHPR